MANRAYTGKPIGLDALKRKIFKQSDKKVGADTNTYKFISRFMDMQLYGEDSKIGKFFGLAGKEVNFSKVIHSIKNYGQLLGLGLNLAVGATGMATAFLAQLGMAANGRYFDFSGSFSEFQYRVSSADRGRWFSFSRAWDYLLSSAEKAGIDRICRYLFCPDFTDDSLWEACR
mgnify:CR=1 FL=1